MPRNQASSGTWWRHDEYKIDDGWIRPTATAQLTRYDPWKDFRDSRNLTVGQAPLGAQPPYQSLLELHHGLQYRPGTRRYPDCLTPESINAILKWCRRHGPLGTLLSSWEAISLAPIERSPGDFTHRRFMRGPGQGIQVWESSGNAGNEESVALIHGFSDLNLREEPPGKTWGRYFPSVDLRERDTFAYPEPYSDEFLAMYAERVIDFCRAARYLAGVVKHLQSVDSTSAGNLARAQALEGINILRKPVTSTVDFDDQGKPYLFWEAPSLLASFAEMFIQDLLFGRPIVNCACCGVPFASSNYQALFCSLACRYRGQKQRLRSQMRQARELRVHGRSIREIAISLGQKEAIVSGWLRKRPVKTNRASTRVR